MTIVNTNIAETINIGQNGTYDVARYTTANVSVGGSKYDLLARVKDDTDKDIGCVVGYHTDANNQKYAVICLNAEHRLVSGKVLSGNVAVPNMTNYSNQSVYEGKTTATENCDAIMSYVSLGTYTSTAVSHCRSKSFIIGGITYYGQLPNIVELIDVFRNRTAVNSADPTSGQYSSKIIPINTHTCSSTQNYGSNYNVAAVGTVVITIDKSVDCFVAPILEIPIQ